jgi:hypothetical protein
MTRHVNNGGTDWQMERIARLTELAAEHRHETAAERHGDHRDRLRRARTQRIVGGILEPTEGDDFIHQLASNSVPVGHGEGEGQPAPKPPAKPPRAPATALSPRRRATTGSGSWPRPPTPGARRTPGGGTWPEGSD